MKQRSSKYIFVVGGVMSSVGKGVTSASLGNILQSRGFKVTNVKCEMYVNIDAGTIRPTEHGEVYVGEDGVEADQDLGNYERFTGRSMTLTNFLTQGQIYQEVIRKERALEYGGEDVEVVPDIPNEIIRRIQKATKTDDAEITIVEIGGTVGEYQIMLFLEAARMMKIKHPDDVMFVMVSYLPVPPKVGEMKTKPTQYAARTLNAAGIQPDIIVARSHVEVDAKRKAKIGMFCNIPAENVISAPDVDSIYDIPLNFEKDNLSARVLSILKLKPRKSDLKEWKHFVQKMKRAEKEVSIAVVGKYFDTGDYMLSDSYISVIESIKFSCAVLGCKPRLTWLNSKDFEKEKASISALKRFDGIIVPGGFGEAGVEGKIAAIRYAREHKIPYFGLCYGMQLAVIEYARNVVGLKDAHTTEVASDTQHPVIDIMPEQRELLAKKTYGASMRLGTYPAVLKKGSIAYAAYRQDSVSERHRHRYEVNPIYIERLTKAGLVFSGTSPDGVLMEIAELPRTKHPFFLGTQFHPEFLARPLAPHPLFTAFVRAAMAKKKRPSPKKR
jgi:CTP synthase